MPPERIAESLPYINWTVLTALAVGTFLFVVAARFRTDATRGYLAFTSFTAAAFAALAAASNGGLPGPPLGATGDGNSWPSLRLLALIALAIVALVYAIALKRGSRATPLAIAGLAAAATAVGSAAILWGSGPPAVAVAQLLLLVQLIALSAALGGVWAAMILGHWYLVTPRLPEAPLVRVARWLTFVLAAQVVLFVAWTGLGAGPAGTPAFGALTGDWAMFVWLRLLVGLVFPLVVSWAAIQTARTRSMESATGLLYINIGTIASGTILSAGLYFGAGLLV